MRSLLERLRDSLFFVPAFYIAGAALLAWLVNIIDGSGVPQDLFFLLPASLSGARSLLQTVAAATITVSALVFSITALSVQLASSYSPRVLQNFLRDRFQKNVVGFVSGTFTYSLIALATLGTGGSGTDLENQASWAATTATVLGVGAVLAIVGFIDRTTRRVRVDDLIKRITSATSAAMVSVFSDSTPDASDEGWRLSSETQSMALRAPRGGWVQHIDTAEILSGLQPGSVARAEARVGDYVAQGDRLLTVWSAKGDQQSLDKAPIGGFTIGGGRSMRDDPGFGLRQLVDIALRALSPGINDPGTAATIVYHLVEPLRIALTGRPRSRVFHDGDKHLATPLEQDREDFVRDTLAEIRRALDGQVLVAAAIVDAIGSLKEQIIDEEPDARTHVLDRELELLLGEVDRWKLTEADFAPIASALDRKRLST